MQALKDFFLNNKIIITILIVLIFGFVSYFIYANNSKNDNLITYVVGKADISESVEVSGQVEAGTDLNLSFEKGGLVSAVNYKTGDKVLKGSILASLGAQDIVGRVREAEASLMAQQAELQRLESGATAGETNIKVQALENAKKDLEILNSQSIDTVNNTKNSLSNIINYTLSPLFTKNSSGYVMTFSGCDQALQSKIESRRSYFDTITFNNLESAKSKLSEVDDYVSNNIFNLINLPCTSSDSLLDSKRLAVSSAKTQLTAIYTDINTKSTQIQNANNAINRAEKDLALTNEGVDINKINFQKAQVAGASARLIQARAELSKSNIISPITGIIGSVDTEVGQNASAGKGVIRIISDSSLEVKANISENDIIKLKINNAAKIKLDAYPDTEFGASITSIDPAATTISGVPRYKVTLTFANNEEKVKVGMTANAEISTQSKTGVLVIPSEYVKIKLSEGIVKKLNDDKKTTLDTTVKIGIRDAKGNIEILEGLSEGDVIVK